MKELHIVSGTIKGNAYEGEDSDLLWTGTPEQTPQDLVAKAIDGLEDDYAEVQPLDTIMQFLRAGEEPVVARDELNREQTHVVEFQWRDQDA